MLFHFIFQVTALNGVKQSLSQALDLERTNNEKSKIEVRELTQKLRATKAAMQVCVFV